MLLVSSWHLSWGRCLFLTQTFVISWWIHIWPTVLLRFFGGSVVDLTKVPAAMCHVSQLDSGQPSDVMCNSFPMCSRTRTNRKQLMQNMCRFRRICLRCSEVLNKGSVLGPWRHDMTRLWLQTSQVQVFKQGIRRASNCMASRTLLQHEHH
jgi:hypothetical protein